MRDQKAAKGVTSGYVDKFKERTKDKSIGEFIKERVEKGNNVGPSGTDKDSQQGAAPGANSSHGTSSVSPGP